MTLIQLCSRLRRGWFVLLAGLLCAPAQAATGIIKSPNDHRQYRTFTLPNELRVLVISDPQTDKAAASLDVYVGSSSDPADRQGLAHFLEHMLFLGTEKYPEPGEYQSFISAHGGSHNAYTAFEHTNYFFDIDKDYLEPALARFAQFFVAPLFNPEYVERERNAVDSEFQLRRKSDGRRVFAAFKEALNPRHPLSDFDIGSLQTLADRPGSDVRDELVAFYRQHYSANIMTLVVLGREPPDVLERWTRERFSAVRNTHAKPLDIEQPLFEKGRLPVWLNVVPIKEKRELSLSFPIPPLLDHYRSKPVGYIANLLGHEGKGSLLSLLKEKGWAEGLSAGAGLNNRNNATVEVSVSLTEDGLNHVDDIISYTFEYIDLVRKSGVERWIFDEQRRLSEIDFRFQEKQRPIGYVSSLAHNLQIYPATDVLRGPYEMENYDPALIDRYLDLLRPQNMLVTLVAKGLETSAVTPWFDAPYEMRPVPQATLARWAAGVSGESALALPQPNPFIPEDLAVNPFDDATPKPVRALEQPGLELWFQQDADFPVPRSDFFFSVRSNLANDTPEHAVLTRLYVKLVNEQLNEFAYPARLAGLDYRLYKHIRGFTVRISGYDDKQELLLRRIVAALRNPQISDERFAIFKERLARVLNNRKEDSPYSQTIDEVNDILLMPHWTEQQRLAALQPLGPDDLRSFVPKLLGKIELVALAHGNLRRDEALHMAGVLKETLLEPAIPAQVSGGKVVKLDPGVRYVREVDVDQPDSAVTVYFQGDERSFEKRAQAGLLAQILSAPFYQELRTEKQLGYVVFVQAMPLLDVPGIAFIVQSPVADPIELERDVEQFVSAYAAKLEAMSGEEFATQKKGLVTRILQNEERLSERTDRYWNEIDRERYGFDTRERLAAAVRAIDKPELERAYRELLLGSTQKRLMVRAVGTRHRTEFAHKERSARELYVQIRDPQAFKQAQAYFPWLKLSELDRSALPTASARTASRLQ